MILPKEEVLWLVSSPEGSQLLLESSFTECCSENLDGGRVGGRQTGAKLECALLVIKTKFG